MIKFKSIFFNPNSSLAEVKKILNPILLIRMILNLKKFKDYNTFRKLVYS